MKSSHRAVILATFALFCIGLSKVAHAEANPVMYLRTDRASYSPGDTGSLLITIRNQGDQAVTIKNYSISFPWMMYINDHWDGNVTVNNIGPNGNGQALASGGGTFNTQQSFTIPSDGRAYHFSTGTLKVGTDLGGNGGQYVTSFFTITMNAPTYTPVEVSTSLFSILLVGILAVATFLLFTVSMALKKLKTPNTSTTPTNTISR